jgi:hypothetical protein
MWRAEGWERTHFFFLCVTEWNCVRSDYTGMGTKGMNCSDVIVLFCDFLLYCYLCGILQPSFESLVPYLRQTITHTKWVTLDLFAFIETFFPLSSSLQPSLFVTPLQVCLLFSFRVRFSCSFFDFHFNLFLSSYLLLFYLLFLIFNFVHTFAWGTMLQAERSRDRIPMGWRTMALGLTQPLTEINTTNILGGKGRPARKGDNPTAISEPTV